MDNRKNIYQDKWESRSSIRTRPRKYIDFSLSGDFFPPDKQLLLLIPEVSDLGNRVKSEILLQSFYKYLNDIVGLESKLIIAACNKLLSTDIVVKYSEETKLNTHTIIIDEYYHIYVAKDMINQLNSKFLSLPQLSYEVSDAYAAVETIKNLLSEKYHDIFEILAVCIFETTLVRELIEFFDSKDIHPSVKYYINDHMNDEAKHYGFFYDLLCYTWNNLSDKYKENIGKHFADFVKLYLNINSEKNFNIQVLIHLLKDEARARQLVNNLYHGFDITPDIPIVKNVLSVFGRSGILDYPCVREGFIKQKLI